MKLITSRLTKRYLLITLIVILIVLSSVYGFSISVMNRSFISQIQYRDSMISTTLAKKVEYSIKKMINDVRFVSTQVEQASPENLAFPAETIQTMLVHEPLYLFIQLIGKDGQVLARIPEARHQGMLEIGPIAERLAWSQTFVVSGLLQLPDGKRTFCVAYPILDAAGDYQGGIMAFVNLSTLSDSLRESQIGPEGMAALVDPQGAILAHSNKAYIGHSLRQHPMGGFLARDRYGVWEGEWFGERVIASYRPLFLGSFGLIVGESSRQAWAPSRHFALLLLQGFLAVLAVAVGLSLYGASKVVTPILALTRQAREYQDSRRKNFDPIPTRDEIEDLSRTMGQMALALTERERRLFYILESIPYGVVTLDRDGRITTFNHGAEELTGFGREEVVGKPIIELPFKPSQEAFLSWRTLKEGKEFDEAESYILDKQGQRHDVRLHSALFRGEDDRLMGAILVLRDVGDLKKLEDYLRQSERLAALGKLTAGVAHEIKNPLSIIQAAAEAIQLEVEDGSQADSIQALTADILATTARMDGLLRDFLSLSREGDEGGEPQQTDLVAILEELCQLLKKKCLDQEIELRLQCPQPAAPVLGRRHRLTQVFLNILLNSLQAMGPGGRLGIRLQDDGSHWEVVVADTGRGIPATELPWIFSPFFSTKREGTGLGLSIAYEIIAEHDGKIWATSTEGEGTTMHVQIPKY